MTNIIFDLPEVLTSAVLSRWIQFKDFGKFHTAVCNRAGRSALTTLLASENCVFSYSYKAEGLERDEEEVDLPTKWILDNGVKVREIVLWGEYLEDPLRRKTVLGQLASTLESMTLNLMVPVQQYCIRTKFHNMFAPDGGVHLDIESVLRDLAEFCPRVKALHLHRTELDSNFRLDNAYCCVLKYIQHRSDFRSIGFTCFEDVPSSFVIALSEIQSLREVNFAGCTIHHQSVRCVHNSNRNAVQSLCVHQSASVCGLFPNITDLTLTGVKGSSIILLAKFCPHIQNLKLEISKGVVARAEVDAMIGSWHNIVTLKLFESNITELQLVRMLKMCKTLTTVWTLEPNEDDSLATVPTINYHPCYVGSRLRTLVTECHSAHTLSEITAACGHLHTLYLDYNIEAYTDYNEHLEQDLMPIIRSKAHNLRVLYLFGYWKLCDADILCLAGCQLESLTLYGAGYVNTSAARQLVAALPRLHTLAILYCSQIAYDIVLDALRVCPRLTSLTYVQPMHTPGSECSRQSMLPALVAELLPMSFPRVKYCKIVC